MNTKLSAYVAQFNRQDEELFRNKIPNAQAADFLREQIPLVDLPDPEIEEIYYFRWWTFRKHIRQTEKGHIITEFLPDVPWSGPHNSIVCPACFHTREGRWLKDPDSMVKEYISFWLDGHGSAFDYSSWLPAAVWEFCLHKNDIPFAKECLPKLIRFFETRQARHKRSCGLYWQDDNHDGMEYSISGPGLRPTMNSYVWADAVAISQIAALVGNAAVHHEYTKIAADIKAAMDQLLWDGSFYKTIPLGENDDPSLSCRPKVDNAHDARELVGFIPWYFSMPDAETPPPFATLTDPKIFHATYGLTSAEQGHPKFMEAHDHECLWNGPVWPFATSQVLVAASNLLRNYPKSSFSKEDYYLLLKQYANSQHMVREDGTIVPWIDEDLHPYTGRWLARDELNRFPQKLAECGLERGKDYNHSLFCDLILSGLLGIQVHEGKVSAQPLIPDHWNWFRVENLWIGETQYRITFDRDGSHYGGVAGLIIEIIGSSDCKVNK